MKCAHTGIKPCRERLGATAAHRHAPGCRHQAQEACAPDVVLTPGVDDVVSEASDDALLRSCALSPEEDVALSLVEEPAIGDRRFGLTNHRPGLSHQPLTELLRWQACSYLPAMRR